MLVRVMVALLLSSAGADVAHATRYWVDLSGNDANSCESVSGESDPGLYRQTIAGGISCLVGGDRLTIKSGTYTGALARIRTVPSGTANAPTIIEGSPNDNIGCAITHTCTTIIQSASTTSSTIQNRTYIIVRKMFLDNSANQQNDPLEIDDSTHIDVEDVEFTTTLTTSGTGNNGVLVDPGSSFVTFRRIYSHHNGSGTTIRGHGMYLQGDDITVEDSLSEHNSNSGIQCYTNHTTSDGRSDRCTLQRNIIRFNGSSGILMEGHDNKIIGNVIYGNIVGAGMILGYSGAARAQIYKNTVVNNTTAGISMRSGTGGGIIQDNVVSGNGGAEIENLGSGTLTITHNACLSSESCGTTGKLSIASLASIFLSSSDFRLKAGSAAIDAGTAAPGARCNSTCDMGAYEAIPAPTATINANEMTLVFPMGSNVPVHIPSSIGVSVSCTGHASCPGAPTISSAARIPTTDTNVSVIIAGITGNACQSTQTWTISYNSSTGTWSDTASIGGTSQPIFSFTGLSVTNQCSGGGPPPPPSGIVLQYKFEEGTGTNANDETANNLDGTLTNGVGWGAGKNGLGVVMTGGSLQHVAIPDGNGFNPSLTSKTIAFGVNVPVGAVSTTLGVFGVSVGTNQRLHIQGQSGTWRLGIQGSTTNSGASNLTVASGWNHLCLQMDSATDTATLYLNGVAGSGSASKTYTSYALASNFKLGLYDINTAPAATYDDLVIYNSVEDCASIYAAFQGAPPTTSGTLAQAAIQFQSVHLVFGSPLNFGGLNDSKSVVAGGAVAVVFQIHCQNIADCDPTAFRLTYKRNGSSVRIQVPNVETADGIWMFGESNEVNLNRGDTSTRLTGTCAITIGITKLTADQIPSVDLPQDGCVMERYLVHVRNPGDYFDLALTKENGLDLNGGYAVEARITVIDNQASTGP